MNLELYTIAYLLDNFEVKESKDIYNIDFMIECKGSVLSDMTMYSKQSSNYKALLDILLDLTNHIENIKLLTRAVNYGNN